MIDKVTYNEVERFLFAGLVARQMDREAQAESAGLIIVFRTPATSAVKSWSTVEQRAEDRLSQKRVPTRSTAPDLEPYAGEWVVISGDRVAEHGTDLTDVVNRARQRGDSKPYVIFVEQLKKGAARMSI